MIIMNRRQFMISTTAALAATLVGGPLAATGMTLPREAYNWKRLSPYNKGPAPKPEITAAVNVLVPADPEIPGDFVGSDYNGDWVLASILGDIGQIAVVFFLNKYAKQVGGNKFLESTPEEQLNAIKLWITERDNYPKTFDEMLTGLLTISMIGTYEDNDPEDELILFESMGWYDPTDPSGTFRIPCEGYPDANQFPVRLKKGLR